MLYIFVPALSTTFILHLLFFVTVSYSFFNLTPFWVVLIIKSCILLRFHVTGYNEKIRKEVLRLASYKLYKPNRKGSKEMLEEISKNSIANIIM